MHARRIAIALIAMVFACTKDDSPGVTGPGPVSEVDAYLRGLRTWAAFSPPRADAAAAPIPGTARLVQDTAPRVTTIGGIGDTTPNTELKVAFVCAVQKYSLTQNPNQIVMFDPDASLMYPGAFIQGKSHRDGLGKLLPLVINERAPIRVSIPGLQNDQNFLQVDTVDQAHVAQAIGRMVGNAVADSLQAPQTSSFKMESFHSEQEFALSMSMSGKYLGYKASASGSFSQNSSETTVAVQFYHKMFTVVVAPPATPGGWFTSDFTQGKLQQQVDQGRLGPDNLPVYLSEVVYGRMMMFTMTSTASETEIRATLNASYKSIGASGSVDISARQKKILETSSITIATFGGSNEATAAMIRSGQWADYFDAASPLSAAAPLSYTFRNVGDNSIAGVTESATYDVKTCRRATDGQFEFLLEQSVAPPVDPPFEVVLGHVNDDAIGDLVSNHRSFGVNQVAVALGGPLGTFQPALRVNHSAAASETWGKFRLVTGDVNGDGRMDLVWSRLDSTTNKTYVAIAGAGGGYAFDPVQVHAARPPQGGNWFDYQLLLGDVDGDGDDDFAWNLRTASGNYLYTALSNGGVFARDTIQRKLDAANWSQNAGMRTPDPALLADVNQDGKADYVANYMYPGVNGVWTARSGSDSAGHWGFGAMVLYQHQSGWGYQSTDVVFGDFTGDGVPEFNWSQRGWPAAGNMVYFSSASDGSGRVIFDPSYHIVSSDTLGTSSWSALGGDVDGDGHWDLVWTFLPTNRDKIFLRAVRGTGSTVLATTPLQNYPVATNWIFAKTLVGDVTGEGRADVVWVIPGVPTRIFVAWSRPSAPLSVRAAALRASGGGKERTRESAPIR